MAKQFTDDNFATEVVNASKDKPVLVDFFATWCGPCQMQGPIVDEVADVMGDKAVVGKLNVEEGNNTAQQFGVMSIPTLIIFKDGQPAKHFVGVQTKDMLVKSLQELS